MVGNKHAFFSAIFIENYSSILAYTYNGAFYLWRTEPATDKNYSQILYKSHPVIHGHFGPVSDISWDNSNSFLISSSEDQTSRAFALWEKNGTWHEINRPQIHGYDINTISALNVQGDNTGNNYICRIVSGADEKIIRVFQPPFNIIQYLQKLSNINLRYSKENDNSFYEKCKENIL
jgi:elongator complex protein 2